MLSWDFPDVNGILEKSMISFMLCDECHRGIDNMDSKEIARQRVLSLIDSREPSGICAEAKFRLRANTVSEWRYGRSTSYMHILQEIAKEYGVSTDWLLGVETEVIVPDMIDVPIIGRIRAGYPIETFQFDNGVVRIPKDYSPAGEFFALEVSGDSMMPLMMSGDIIVCEKRPQNKCNGEICVITVDGESTLKKLLVDSQGVTLIPLNPMYQQIHFTKREVVTKKLTVDGVVIQQIRRFGKPPVTL